MQSHAYGELEMSKEGENLTGRVFALENGGTLRVTHAADDRMAVLNIERSSFHRNEDHFCIESIDQEVSRVCKQPMIVLDIETGRYRPWFSN